MYHLNLPQYAIRLGGTKEKPTVFDVLRRKHVALTPEEWVRQHFIHYLIEHKGYPQAWLANEVELRIGEKRMRCDSVLYNKVLQPRMIIEYKAPTVPLQQKVFDQIADLTGRNRNEILTMSLEFALNHMEIVMNDQEDA